MCTVKTSGNPTWLCRVPLALSRIGKHPAPDRVLCGLSRLRCRCDDDEMLIATMNDLPGYRIEEVYGEVTGLTVRSRNIGAQLGAGLKSLVGGELKGLTKQLMQSREEALARLMEAATSRGANAVIAMRFDANEVSAGYQEIVAYGTAVRVTKDV